MYRFLSVWVIGTLAAWVLVGCSTDTFSTVGPHNDAALDAVDIGDGAQNDATDPPGDAGDAGVTDATTSDGFDGYVGPMSRRVFISSGQWTANLGGASGADAKCQDAASAAGLGGTWMAWLSTSSSSPSTRFTHSTVSWKLLDGTVIANDWSDLISGSLENRINRDEHDAFVSWTEGNGGVTGTLGIAWTDTSTAGTCSGYSNCSSFGDGTSTSAFASVGYNGYSGTYQGFFWTDAQESAGYACISELSLLCFEQ